MTASSRLLVCLLALGACAFKLSHAGSWREEEEESESSSGGGVPWLLVLGGMLALTAAVLVGSAIALASWLYSEYKQVTGYMSLGRFAVEVVQRLWRGENPLKPVDSSSSSRTSEGGLVRDIVLPATSLAYKYATRYGLDKVDEVLHKYLGESESEIESHERKMQQEGIRTRSGQQY